MKISTRSRYSLRFMIHLADYGNGTVPISLKEIAENQEFSLRYLEHMVVGLKNANLVKSTVGKNGGYILTRKPEDISVGEIIEAVTGEIRVMDCLDSKFDCHFQEKCKAQRMWNLLNTRIKDVLFDYSLADLSEKALLECFETEKSPKKLPC